MKRETKLDLWALGICPILMLAVYLVHGFPSLIWAVGCAFFCLLASGLIVLALGKFLAPKRDPRASNEYAKVPHGDAEFEMERRKTLQEFVETAGRVPSPSEIAELEILIAELLTTQKELKRMEHAAKEVEDQDLRRRAESVLKQIAEERARNPITADEQAAIRRELKEIQDRLRELGFRFGDSHSGDDSN